MGAHVARKRFGQHFLVDGAVLGAIVSAVDPRPGDVLVEIGPGLAALTDRLVERLPRMHAVELDRDLVARLRRRHPPERLDLHEADALAFDFGALADAASGGAPGPVLRIVGNLPYNISSPLLIRLIEVAPRVRDQHFMLQKEVVDRIAAGPGEAAYGRLGVLLQAWYDIESLFDVPPDAFDPPPRVDSAVFRMRPLPAARVRDRAALEAVLAAGFGQRRKMLRGTLLPWLAERGVEATGIDGTARAEDVPQSTWYALADRLSAVRAAATDTGA